MYRCDRAAKSGSDNKDRFHANKCITIPAAGTIALSSQPTPLLHKFTDRFVQARCNRATRLTMYSSLYEVSRNAIEIVLPALLHFVLRLNAACQFFRLLQLME